jgi:hypothetical protein
MDHPEIFRQHRAYGDFICHRTGPNDEQWLAASGVQKLDPGKKRGRMSRQYINHRKRAWDGVQRLVQFVGRAERRIEIRMTSK